MNPVLSSLHRNVLGNTRSDKNECIEKRKSECEVYRLDENGVNYNFVSKRIFYFQARKREQRPLRIKFHTTPNYR